MHNVLDLRVYRAAFVPALLALFVVAFSLEGRPSPARTRAVADAFDPARAFGTPQVRDSLLQLGAAFPDRRPGSAGRRRARRPRGRGLRAPPASRSTRSDRRGAAPSTGRPSSRRSSACGPGRSSRRIVVLAHRDALDSPGPRRAVGHRGAARAGAHLPHAGPVRARTSRAAPGRPQLVGRDLRKTLVLVSTSGGSGGGAGARAWARAQDAGAIDGVLVLGDLASARLAQAVGRAVVQRPRRSRRSAGSAPSRPPCARRSAPIPAARARARSGRAARSRSTVTEQGEVNRAGLPGGAAADQRRARARRRGARVSRERFTELGRAALRAVTALDEAGRRAAAARRGPPFAGEPDGDRDAAQRAAGLERAAARPVPAAAGAARRARRVLPRAPPQAARPARGSAGRSPPASRCRWPGSWLRVLGITGALPAPRGPVLPADLPLTSGQAAALASVALALAGGVLAARLLARPERAARGNPAAGAAGAAVGAIVCGVALARLGRQPVRRGAAAARRAPVAVARRAADALRGALGLARARRPACSRRAFVLVAEMRRAADRPARARAAVAGRDRGRARLGAGRRSRSARSCGCVAALVRVLLARRRIAAVAPPDERPRTRGPATYAGPGSLGGTESALRALMPRQRSRPS